MSSKIKNDKKAKVDAILSSSESSSEDVQVTKKPQAKKTEVAKRKVSAASETSESVNLLKNKIKQNKEKPVAKKQPKPSSDSESEEKVTKKKPVAKKGKVDSDSDSDDKKKKAPVKKANYSEESDSESEKPKKAVAKKSNASDTKKANGNGKKAKKDSDSESEKVVAKKTVVSKKKDDSDSDEGEKKNNVAQEDDNEDGHKELFVKNLSWNTDQDKLYEYFGQFGEVVNVKVLTDKMTGKPRGIAFVEFAKHSEAKKALANVSSLDGRDLQCTMSNDKPQRDNNAGGGFRGGNDRGGDRGGNQRSNFSGERFTVFVGNLGFKTNENSVKKFFGKAGNVVDVRIAKHEDGKAKGFCHVDFDSQEAVNSAIAMAGQDLDGREVRVDASQPRSSQGGSGGGFRGGRGGPRGGRGGGRGGFDKPTHSQMGTTGTKKKFNDDSD